MSFNVPPHAPTIPVSPFTPHIPQSRIDDLKARLAFEAPRATTYDNSTGPAHLGARRRYLDTAIAKWRDSFRWRDVEEEIAQFPGYMATVHHRNHTYRVHYLALWSEKPDAVPIVFCHGWPGSVLEFVPMLKLLKEKYTPKTLPYHIVVPALIGYGFSSPPPLDFPFTSLDNAGVFDAMMRGLGFGRENGKGIGYIVQGGDVGSYVARNLSRFESVLGVHVNFFPLLGSSSKLDVKGLDELDQRAMKRAVQWERWGQGYFWEHATKPATIGAVLESSPIALLAWIGEKLNDSGIPDSLNWTLAEVSLYWFTNSAATCLWQYKAGAGKDLDPNAQPPKRIDKPFGYSQFMNEIFPTPIEWIKARTNLVFARRHAEGGHFAALEKPALLWGDVSEFADIVVQQKAKL
ncbi:hypothetical protein VHUM_03519 [Vanrija humicola]|uniref:Epoxide hydrolase N-terminal domain-containing protein n=1 Tax=Vanrija humicola TaxID=5417 RepID=A0A7D8Z1I1_VANHU|nr:hypothetical protein VHUM_03519 [Vanrija humicola]